MCENCLAFSHTWRSISIFFTTVVQNITSPDISFHFCLNICVRLKPNSQTLHIYIVCSFDHLWSVRLICRLLYTYCAFFSVSTSLWHNYFIAFTMNCNNFSKLHNFNSLFKNLINKYYLNILLNFYQKILYNHNLKLI
jgi:hypothetical protein